MLFNRKGQGILNGLNLLFAIIVLAGGALPLLSKFGVIGEIPAIPTIVIQILTIIGGFLLLLDGFMGTRSMRQVMPKMLNLVVSLVVLVGGVLPLLSQLGVIGQLPDIPLIVFQGLLVVAGLVLLLDGLLGASPSSF
ncbi:MAG: hypothetical protein KC535_06230 [Nanoarchaeota archaeon]|nr:hypothetical protein [Nanoarchaeota archaeon]